MEQETPSQVPHCPRNVPQDRLAQRQKPPQSLKLEIESKVAKGTPLKPQSKACDLGEKPAFWPALLLIRGSPDQGTGSLQASAYLP